MYNGYLDSKNEKDIDLISHGYVEIDEDEFIKIEGIYDAYSGKWEAESMLTKIRCIEHSVAIPIEVEEKLKEPAVWKDLVSQFEGNAEAR